MLKCHRSPAMEAGLGALVKESLGPLPLIPAEQVLLDLERARMRAEDHESEILKLRQIVDDVMDDDSESDVDPSSDEDLEDEDMAPERVFRYVFLVGDRVRVSPNFEGHAELHGATGAVYIVNQYVTVRLDAPVLIRRAVWSVEGSPHNFEHLTE